MKISGFTYVKNGFDYGVPFMESIQSILPICDEFIAVVGNSDDGTREAIQKLQSPKITIIDTIWDKNLRKGGKVFAQQTNIGVDNISGNWAFHIQADEVIHENDLPKILQAINENDDDKKVEGFILPFLHFWGGYNYIRNTRRIHKYEIRIFRTGLVVRSYKDSQGFRKFSSIQNYNNETEKGNKLVVKKIDAPIFHYNGIRPPAMFRKKAEQMGLFYKNENEVTKELNTRNYNFDNIDRVELFTQTHPALMQPKVDAQDWAYVYNPKKSVWKTKDKILQPIEDLLGFKIGDYKNYKLIK